MSKDERKSSWWTVLGAPVLVRVLAGVILLALPFVLPVVRSFVAGVFGAVPATAYWVLGLCAAAAAVGFLIGQRVERARSQGKWITRMEAEATVRASNYWSKLERRSKLYELQAQRDFQLHGFEYEPEPYEIEAVAIKPPRHTFDVDAVLHHFWDDRPRGRDGDLYHRPTLRNWLAEQASEVELPTI